jgi:predicted dithiol-disulfide oxidoreductase (DUF899 family)
MNADHQGGPVRGASKEEWRAALTAMKDAVAAERRALPWVRIEKNYVFDGPSGPLTLVDLFAGRSQLFIKHFMTVTGMGRYHEAGCGCAAHSVT